MKQKTILALLLSAAALPLSATATRAESMRIEIDYMVSAGHSHQPSQAVLDAVIQMFACQGHTLTIEVSNSVTHFNVLRRNPNGSGCANCNAAFFTYSGEAASFGSIKAANFDHAGDSPAWHYCIFAHQYEDGCCNTTTSSGLAEGSSDDFIVSLGAFSGSTGTLFDQAATLAHEFGHNIGLSHCGSMDCGSDTTTATYVGPFVPNMPSVMSYRYQLNGVKTNMIASGLSFDLALFKDIDYSHGRMCTLNEDSLSEVAGTQMVSTDFNCSGVISGTVAQDINGGNGGWCGASGNRTVITDFNEWSSVDDPLSGNGGGGDGGISPDPDFTPIEYSCITAEEAAEVEEEMIMRGVGVQPPLATESCISGQNMYVGTFFIAEIGTCVFPYDSVIQAHNAAPNNSRFYLKPGTYNETNNSVLNKPGYYFCNTGTAVVE